MTVTLTGQIFVQSDRLDAIRAALPEHIRLTRAEPGCLSFSVMQHPGEPGRFDVTEEFTTPDAFRAHRERVGASGRSKINAGLERINTISGMLQ
jgi:quinol monooxygenase YgiN